MSKGHSPRPYNAAQYGENFIRIFRKDDPVRSLVPGTIRARLSNCCGTITRLSEGRTYDVCVKCGLPCQATLTQINP